jgi:hypothetical protein
MSSVSDEERSGEDNLTPNGDVDEGLNDEMEDLFGDEVDEDAEARA